MQSYLDKIIETKALVVAEQKAQESLKEIHSKASDSSPPKGFIDAIRKRDQQGLVSVIAEIKKASPSKGIIRKKFLPQEIAQQYEKKNATCLSILTVEEYFQGSLNYLESIRASVNLPLLRKDFMIDEYQIYQSKAYGADCILLIASVLTDAQLQEYKEIAESIGLDVLVEIHNKDELRRITPIDFSLIGINNRNLSTFEVDLNTTKELSSEIEDKLVVSESGIKTNEDIDKILSFGVLNFLVGESFMRAEDPGEALEKLFF